MTCQPDNAAVERAFEAYFGEQAPMTSAQHIRMRAAIVAAVGEEMEGLQYTAREHAQLSESYIESQNAGAKLLRERDELRAALERVEFERNDARRTAESFQGQFVEAIAELERVKRERDGLVEAAKRVMAMHEGPPDGVGNWDWAFGLLRDALAESGKAQEPRT